MLPFLQPTGNQIGRDVSGYVPAVDQVTGIVDLPDSDLAVWRLAAPNLQIRDNDVHTLYAYGLARYLLARYPEAQPEIVLPAILLHDTGWSRVPPTDVLAAISPEGPRPDLVLLHEQEGAILAEKAMRELGYDSDRIAEIVAIIDGHDSRREALSLNDAIVKDADRIWRLTPHGIDTVMNWFGLTRDQAHRLIASRVHDHLYTDRGRELALALAALASIDCSPERIDLG